MKNSLRIGSRGSRLAMVQTESVKAALKNAHPEIDIIIEIINTEGDIDRNSPLASFGGRGAFVKSIEQALLDNRIDIAVHSLKDLPSELPGGLELGAVPGREDVRDILGGGSGKKFAELPAGSIIGTGSERRMKQILAQRPDLECRGIRGNVETRLKKADSGEYDAVVLAAAGMKRLELEDRITDFFPVDSILPAPCQGAIGIECRADDKDTLSLLSAIENSDARRCTELERLFIATLGMGCHTPVAAFAEIENGRVHFRAWVHPGGEKKAVSVDLSLEDKGAGDRIRNLAEDIKIKIGS